MKNTLAEILTRAGLPELDRNIKQFVDRVACSLHGITVGSVGIDTLHHLTFLFLTTRILLLLTSIPFPQVFPHQAMLGRVLHAGPRISRGGLIGMKCMMVTNLFR